MGAKISNWSLSRDCGHMFVKIPPQFSVADFVRQAKGRSSRKIQQEFENMHKRYSEQRFRQRDYLSTTSGNFTQ